MPRFSDRTRERIRERLLTEGERLFAIHGMKKVTIDELVSAAAIAKATFYTFYDSKESLYLDIAQRAKQRLADRLEERIKTTAALPDKQRVFQLFAAMYAMLPEYPFLLRIDEATIAQIARNVPSERLAMFRNQSLDMVNMLARNGVAFRYAPKVVSLAFEALYRAWLSMTDADEALRTAAITILLHGTIEQIIP